MKIVLGISGSISAYKAIDICRTWTKQGHQVRVVLTNGALKFIKPEIFTYLGADETYLPDDDFLRCTKNSIPHIELANWCDRLVIAPTSANTIAKLANGICDDLLSTLFLAINNKPIVLYPAMNTKMLEHPITKENFERLSKIDHIFIFPPSEGLLACGENGLGKLPPIDTIVETATIFNTKIPPLKKVLITTGATVAPLDPVRYLTNPSSGITGYYIAKAFLEKGFHVTIIAGKNSTTKLDYLQKIPHYQLERVSTTNEMFQKVKKHLAETDLYISAAAIGDIEFVPQQEKIKKETLTNGALPYICSQDILQYVIQNKNSNCKTIGFAAETSRNDPSIFTLKWHKKPVDFLIGNFVNNGHTNQQEIEGFSVNCGVYYFVENGKTLEKQILTKDELAHAIINWYLC